MRAVALFLLIVPLIQLGCSASAPEVATPGSEKDPGRKVVERMIDAHGGLEKWQSAPTVSFEIAVTPAKRPGRVVRETVEQGSRRAYHDYLQEGSRMSWDGEKAWTENAKGDRSARFAARVNYYFMNLPWVAADPGVILGEPGTGKLWDEPADYITVKMTFEPGVGDTPDDYYLLYIDPASYLLKAAEFIVTFARQEPDPARIILYEEYATVDGLRVPVKTTLYWKQDRSLYGTRNVKDWSFREPFDESRMVMPPGAVLDTSSPLASPLTSPLTNEETAQ